jgi:Xaa-Pro aminopeptidase
MAAVTPLVRPGVTMAELTEEIEAELRRAGSRTPSFATHIFTGMDPDSLDTHAASAREPLADGTAVLFDFGVSSTATARTSGGPWSQVSPRRASATPTT